MRLFLIKQVIELFMAAVIGLLMLAYVALAGLEVPGDTLWVAFFVILMLVDADKFLD